MAMSVHELKLQSCEEGLRAAGRVRQPSRESRRAGFVSRWLPGVLLVVVSMLWQAAPARAQAAPTPTPTPVNPCPTLLSPGQDFQPVPEIVSLDGVLRGTMVLGDEDSFQSADRGGAERREHGAVRSTTRPHFP
jgi:hypothetical protein